MKQITKGKKIHEGDTLMVIDGDITLIGVVVYVEDRDWSPEFYLGEDHGYSFYLTDVTEGVITVFRMQKGKR